MFCERDFLDLRLNVNVNFVCIEVTEQEPGASEERRERTEQPSVEFESRERTKTRVLVDLLSCL